jgi:homoaconitase/3-isopropylmalate dehydratase large subunit
MPTIFSRTEPTIRISRGLVGMSTMHALHNILIEHTHPRPSSVQPGDFLEIEPDVFAIQMAPNAEEVDGLEANLAEAGVKTLPLKERIFPYNDHGSPPPMAGIAAGQKRWREFFRSRGIPMPDGGAGISHFILTTFMSALITCYFSSNL